MRGRGSVTPTLATKRLHPHSMRHSTTVHLLRSGVDIATISQWLGHASVTTTNRYATVDLEMKRKAIEQAQPIDRVTIGLRCGARTRRSSHGSKRSDGELRQYPASCVSIYDFMSGDRYLDHLRSSRRDAREDDYIRD